LPRPSSIVAPNRNITKVEIGDVGQQPQGWPGQVVAEESGAAHFGFGGAMAARPVLRSS
jgi:hypothetical protein